MDLCGDLVVHSSEILGTVGRGSDVEDRVRDADDGGLDGGEAETCETAGDDSRCHLQRVPVGGGMLDCPLNVVILCHVS